MRVSTISAAAIFCLVSTGGAYAQDAAALMSSADPSAGETAFRACKACHTVENGAPNRVGPNLYGIVGAPVAAHDGFRYSAAMQDFGGTWTVERLDTYLADPRGTVPGTRMTYRGLKDAEDRANVIAYLNTFSDAPLEFGAEDAAAADDAASDAAPEWEEGEFGQLVLAPGVDDTYYACTACHSEMIVAQQGKTREGWDELLVWMVEEQGMAEIPEPARSDILDYLAEHYNTDRPNFSRP